MKLRLIATPVVVTLDEGPTELPVELTSTYLYQYVVPDETVPST